MIVVVAQRQKRLLDTMSLNTPEEAEAVRQGTKGKEPDSAHQVPATPSVQTRKRGRPCKGTGVEKTHHNGKQNSFCHFGLQCLGCGERTRSHAATLRICVPRTSDGSEQKVPVCRTAKILVMRIGVAKYKAMLAKTRRSEASEKQPTMTKTMLHSQCHFGWQCLGCREGSIFHFGQYGVGVRRDPDGDEDIIALCRTAKLIVKRIGLDDYEAMIQGSNEV